MDYGEFWMNRVIKFRAQQFNHGKNGFQYGSYVTDNKEYHAIIKESKECPVEMYSILINPDTLCQFTGLVDSKGLDIYEGDIVNDSLIGICEVKYNDEYGAFKVLHKNKRTAKWFIDYLPHEFKYLTVVGNIHENPELMER